MVSDDSVALAGGLFEAGSIQDDDFTSGVADEACVLEGFGGYADGGAVGAEHIGEVLVGQEEGGGLGAVGGEEEPAGEALGDAVVGVASGGLRGLDELGLDGAEDEIVKAAEAGELVVGCLDGAGEAIARHLDIDLVEATTGSDESGGPHDGLDAEHTHSNLEAVFKGVGHGADPVFDEDEVIDWLAGVFNFEAGGEFDGFEIETLDNFGVK